MIRERSTPRKMMEELTMFNVWFRFGDRKEYRKFSFDTLQELNAFIKGVQAAGDEAEGYGFDYEQQDHAPYTALKED